MPRISKTYFACRHYTHTYKYVYPTITNIIHKIYDQLLYTVCEIQIKNCHKTKYAFQIPVNVLDIPTEIFIFVYFLWYSSLFWGDFPSFVFWFFSLIVLFWHCFAFVFTSVVVVTDWKDYFWKDNKTAFSSGKQL